jgi:hypothetical protein
LLPPFPDSFFSEVVHHDNPVCVEGDILANCEAELVSVEPDRLVVVPVIIHVWSLSSCSLHSDGISLAAPVLPHGVDPQLLLDRQREGRIVAEPAPIHRLPDRRGKAAIAVSLQEGRDPKLDEHRPGDRFAFRVEAHGASISANYRRFQNGAWIYE